MEKDDIYQLIIARVQSIGISPVLYRDFAPLTRDHGLSKGQIILALDELAKKHVFSVGSYGIKQGRCWHWNRESLLLAGS